MHTTHIPLVIAVLALLAFALLPQLDRFAGAETGAHGVRLFLVRLSHWMNA
jgi:hypothetical protein